MLLFDVVPDLAQSLAPRRAEVAEVWGDLVWADPGDPAQGDGAVLDDAAGELAGAAGQEDVGGDLGHTACGAQQGGGSRVQS